MKLARNDAAIAKAAALAGKHGVKASAYKVDGEYLVLFRGQKPRANSC